MEGGVEAEHADEEDRDSLESKLIVRLHCKHGNFLTSRVYFASLSEGVNANSDGCLILHRRREDSQAASEYMRPSAPEHARFGQRVEAHHRG